MRMRANSSMARLEEDVPPVPSSARPAAVPGPGSDFSGSHSRSGSSSDAMMSSSENYTFGHPLRMQWPRGEQERLEEETPVPETIRVHAAAGDSPAQSNLSVSSPSERPSDRTISRLPTPEWARVSGNGSQTDRGRALGASPSPTGSQPDVLSVGAPPASVEGETDTSED